MPFRAVFLRAAVAGLLIGACRPSPPPPREAPAPRAEPIPVVPTLAGSAESTTVEPPRLPVSLPDAALRARGLDELRRGREFAQARNSTMAGEHYSRAGDLLPPFRDWAWVLSAEAAAAAKDTAEVRRRLSGVAPGPALEWGWRIHVRALRDAGDLAAALRVAEHAGRTITTPAAMSAAWAETGSLRARAGDAAGAMDDFRRAMAVDPQGPGALRAARAALDLGGFTAEDRLLVGRTLLAHGGIERGIANLEAYLASNHGGAAERAAVHLEVGRALFSARQYAAAVRHLAAAAPVSAEASLLAARARYRQGQTNEGREELLATARRFPRTEAAAEALFTLGDLAQSDGRLAAAREHFRQAIATGAHTEAAVSATVRLAGISIREADAHTALADIEAYLGSRPHDSVGAPVLFWAGRAHLLADEAEAARRRFREAAEVAPVSYYGVLAAEQLGESLRNAPFATPPEIDPFVRAEVEAGFFRMNLLRALGRSEEAEFELTRLRTTSATNPAALYLVAEGMIERGQPIAAALLGQQIQRERGAWDERLLRIVYQFPFRDLVTREARRNGLDPYLVAGLIRQESYFNPIAVSRAGAIGLMQVMPETGRGLARRVGLDNFTPSMLKQPEVNVRLGTLFLAGQMRQWGGKPSEVFAAYNAGPSRVARWRSFPEHGDEDLWVERIPFEETRNYVKKVRLHAHIYERLYGDGAHRAEDGSR